MLATIGAGTDAKTALKAAAEKAVAATLVTTAGTVTDAGAVTTLEVMLATAGITTDAGAAATLEVFDRSRYLTTVGAERALRLRSIIDREELLALGTLIRCRRDTLEACTRLMWCPCPCSDKLKK